MYSLYLTTGALCYKMFINTETTGLEPVISDLTGQCSYQLNYASNTLHKSNHLCVEFSLQTFNYLRFPPFFLVFFLQPIMSSSIYVIVVATNVYIWGVMESNHPSQLTTDLQSVPLPLRYNSPEI